MSKGYIIIPDLYYMLMLGSESERELFSICNKTLSCDYKAVLYRSVVVIFINDLNIIR